MLKNLTEATQLLLARCQTEILAPLKTEEPHQDEQRKPVISIEEWRPPEPAHVEKARLTRRAGRHARYQQVVELRKQGMPTDAWLEQVVISGLLELLSFASGVEKDKAAVWVLVFIDISTQSIGSQPNKDLIPFLKGKSAQFLIGCDGTSLMGEGVSPANLTETQKIGSWRGS